MANLYYRTRLAKMEDVHSRAVTALKMQVATLAQQKELQATELCTSKQQVAALSQQNAVLAAELRNREEEQTLWAVQKVIKLQRTQAEGLQMAADRTQALALAHEVATLTSVLQQERETAAQEKQDLETQLSKAWLKVHEQRQREEIRSCSSPTTVAEDTKPLSPRSDISDSDDYVVPPVQVPSKYRKLDLQGDTVIGGEYVLRTSWAFKRQQRRMSHLCPIPERTDAGAHELASLTPEPLVGKSTKVPVQTQQRVRKRAAEESSEKEYLRQVRRRLDLCLANAAARS